MPSMDAVNSKFEWAHGHFQFLYAEITKYMQLNPCRFVPNPDISFDDQGQGWVMGKFVADPPIPSHLPNILGDCIGNLRYCLDYLVWELVGAYGNKPSRKNAFPVCIIPDDFTAELKRYRLDGINPDALAIIESVQPYHRGDDAPKSLLAVLNEFTNINKHRRVLLATLKTAHPGNTAMQVVNGQLFAQVNPPTSQDDAEFGPFRVTGDQVEVKAQMIAYIVFNEAPAESFEVLSMIEAIANYINTCVLPQFERFF